MSHEQSKRLIADTLTLFRFFAAAVVWFSLAEPLGAGERTALLFFLAGAASDFLDGWFARQAGGHTPFGRIVDPLADKALTLSAFAALASRDVVGWWLVWVIAGRDIIVTAARFTRSSSSDRAGARESGKWKTVFQMVFIIGALLLLSFWKDSLLTGSVKGLFLAGSVIIAGLTFWSGGRFLFARAPAA